MTLKKIRLIYLRKNNLYLFSVVDLAQARESDPRPGSLLVTMSVVQNDAHLAPKME